VTGRHARRPPVPFFVVVAALGAIVVGLLAAGRTLGGRGTDVSSTAAPEGSLAPQPPGSPEAAETRAGGAAGATAVSGVLGGTTAVRRTLLIHGTGDVSLDPDYISAFRSKGYGWAWSGLGGLFERDDLTVVNLECPATNVVDPEPKQFVFRCDPAALPVAVRSGIDVVNQSNNHAFDQGPEGLLDSLRRIRAAGLTPVGAGANRADALRPAVFELEGWRVAVLGFDEVLDPVDQVAGSDSPGTAAGHDFSLMLGAVRRAAQRADVVVVMIHWGVELDTQPRAYQVEEGRALIDAGADIIFGGHSHRLQPLSMYRGRPIFWSLGNFVWPHLSAEGSTTAVAEVRITGDGRYAARLLPATIVSDGHPVLG